MSDNALTPERRAELRKLRADIAKAQAVVDAGVFPEYAGQPGWRERSALSNLQSTYRELVYDSVPALLDALDAADELPKWIVAKLKTLWGYYEPPTDGRGVVQEIYGWMHVLCFHYLQNRREVKEYAAARRAAKQAQDKAEGGERFKEFVHRYLDEHNVPADDPNNRHSKEGCRIGARLDLLFAQRDRAGRFAAVVWHRYPEESPPRVDNYLVTVLHPDWKEPLVRECRWSAGDWFGIGYSGPAVTAVVAWAELPKAAEMLGEGK
jgi:hypothetical protein